MTSTAATYIFSGAVCLLTYLVIVRRQRYSNIHHLEDKYAHLVANPEKMTYREAHDIHLLMAL
jgi:hypothetical protein